MTPIPAGYRTLTPFLIIDGAAKALDFYQKALGAKEITRAALPDGRLMHASLKIGDSYLMLCDEFPGAASRAPTSVGVSTSSIHVYTRNVDEMWQKAVLAGMKVIQPLDNQFWGERYGQLMDPFGHVWALSMRINMPAEEKDRKQREAMAAMLGSEKPGNTS